MENVLIVENIKKKFNDVEVLKDVTFSVGKGEIFGFLGRNGAGKSTLINILSGVIHKTSGEFTLLGSKSTNLDKVKNQIGIFPDIDNFYSDMNALQHLRYFGKINKLNLCTKELNEMLDLVGLLKEKNKKVKNYSFGMKKKLGVAQALIGQPQFIILDEPTSGLDPESAIHMRRLIKKIANQGKTIFITSHNLNELEELSTRIAILKEGRISAIGTMHELRQQHQTEDSVVLTLVTPLKEEQFSIFKFPFQTKGNKLIISVSNQNEIAEALKEVIMQGGKPIKVLPKEQTLEEIFLQNEGDK